VKTISSDSEFIYDRVQITSPTPGELAKYAGGYYSPECPPELDIYWTLVAESDHLVARRHKYADSRHGRRLTPLLGDTFGDDWEPRPACCFFH
jgi:hypothetical protein